MMDGGDDDEQSVRIVRCGAVVVVGDAHNGTFGLGKTKTMIECK